MEILLDTNFIISCIKKRIDFKEIAEKIINEKINWIVPQEVLNELGNLKDNLHSKKSDKDSAKISFEILQSLNPKIVNLNKNPNIDIAIVNYILDKDIVLATLDKKLKQRVQNKKILTIRGKNYLEII